MRSCSATKNSGRKLTLNAKGIGISSVGNCLYWWWLYFALKIGQLITFSWFLPYVWDTKISVFALPTQNEITQLPHLSAKLHGAVCVPLIVENLLNSVSPVVLLCTIVGFANYLRIHFYTIRLICLRDVLIEK